MCGRLKNFVNLTEVKSKTEDAMNIEEFWEYCLSLPGVTEKMPFTALNDAYSREVLCFYVGSKWFCYVNIVLFLPLLRQVDARGGRGTACAVRGRASGMAHE